MKFNFSLQFDGANGARTQLTRSQPTKITARYINKAKIHIWNFNMQTSKKQRVKLTKKKI